MLIKLMIFTSACAAVLPTVASAQSNQDDLQLFGACRYTSGQTAEVRTGDPVLYVFSSQATFSTWNDPSLLEPDNGKLFISYGLATANSNLIGLDSNEQFALQPAFVRFMEGGQPKNFLTKDQNGNTSHGIHLFHDQDLGVMTGTHPSTDHVYPTCYFDLDKAKLKVVEHESYNGSLTSGLANFNETEVSLRDAAQSRCGSDFGINVISLNFSIEGCGYFSGDATTPDPISFFACYPHVKGRAVVYCVEKDEKH